MSANATPKQGDHVFNAVDIAVMRPFECIRSLRSTAVDGQHFTHDYLLHCYSMAKRMAEAPALTTARKFVASAGVEEYALREITKLRSRYPALARITPPLVRGIHLGNSSQFGAAADRFERELLASVQQALETAMAAGGGRPAAMRTPAPSIACQQMLGAAYDPAAALVLITNSMSLEALPAQAVFHSVIVAIAETLDRPGMWKEPFAGFRENRPTNTGRMISGIRDVLTQIDLLKAQSMTFTSLIKDEISQKSRSPQTDVEFGAMLHLLHARLQRTH